MPATPATPENVLTRFDKLLIEFEKQRADAADRERAAADREREAAARQEKRDQAMLERFAQVDKRIADLHVDNANLRTKIEQQGKETVTATVIAVGVVGALLGVWIGFLEFRSDNTSPAVSPVTIQYLSPQAESPAPAPATPQPAN